MNKILIASSALLFAAIAGGVPAAAPTPNPDAAHAEIVATLKDFIRIKTINPPGEETKAARFSGCCTG